MKKFISEPLYACAACGQVVMGFAAAHFWYDCGCGHHQPRRLTPEEEAQVETWVTVHEEEGE